MESWSPRNSEMDKIFRLTLQTPKEQGDKEGANTPGTVCKNDSLYMPIEFQFLFSIEFSK